MQAFIAKLEAEGNRLQSLDELLDSAPDEFLDEMTNELMKDPVIVRIAEAHKKTGVQVLIRWAIQRGTICIPKSTNEVRIVSNAQVFDFALTEEEMEAIRALDQHHRNCTGMSFLPSPCTLSDIWDGENVD